MHLFAVMALFQIPLSWAEGQHPEALKTQALERALKYQPVTAAGKQKKKDLQSEVESRKSADPWGAGLLESRKLHSEQVKSAVEEDQRKKGKSGIAVSSPSPPGTTTTTAPEVVVDSNEKGLAPETVYSGEVAPSEKSRRKSDKQK